MALAFLAAASGLANAEGSDVAAPGAIAVEGEAPRRPVCVVLSGGGARGGVHVGVLRALEEKHVRVDAIVGTSMGAIVGGLYAAGLSPDEIEAALTGVDWSDAFRDLPPRADRSFRRKGDDESFVVKLQLGVSPRDVSLPAGLLQGQEVLALLDRHALRVAGVRDFDEMPIPVRAIASDAATGQAVVLRSGRLTEALRASMSIPGLFAPYAIDGRLLMDGGVASNLPVRLAMQEFPDAVIVAVDVTTPPTPADKLGSLLAVMTQLTNILTANNVALDIAALRESDVLLRPELGDAGTLDFQRFGEAAAIGLAAARARATDLARFGRSPEEHAAWLASVRRSVPAAPLVVDIGVETDSPLGTGALEARLRQRVGEPLAVEALERDLRRVHGLGVFDRVSWRLDDAAGGKRLVVNAARRALGPGYLQFGLHLDADSEGRNRFRLGAAYTLTELNSRNAEWRTELQLGDDALIATQLHQPFGERLRWFVAPGLRVGRSVRSLHDRDDELLGEYQRTTAGARVDAGRELGTWGEVRVGAWRTAGHSEARPRGIGLPEGGWDASRVFGRLSLDTLDDLRFPRHGLRAAAEYGLSREGWGGDADFDLAGVSLLVAGTRGRNTLLGRGRWMDTVAGDLPYQERVELGGFLDVSGLRPGQLDGQGLAYLSAVYLRRLGRSLITPLYAGAALEGGMVWEQDPEFGVDGLIPAGAVFLGYDSPIGPVTLGAGFAERGRAALYLQLGRTF